MSVDPKESFLPVAEISQEPNAFEAFLDRNQKGIVVFAVLLAIAAVAIVIFRGIETSRQETAGAELTKAEDLSSLQALTSNHADTTAGASGMVLLANSQWADGKKDEAVGTLQKFISSSPTHPAIQTAKASLGAKLMAQGKTGDAAKVFDELVADPDAGFIAPFALLSLGDISKASGDLEKAEASYNKVKSLYPESGFAEAASRRIAILKAKPPVEIDPPPAPATPDSAPAPSFDASKLNLPPGVTVTPTPAPAPPATPEP
jgi:predicted negative regulator of RcsB-dependent stress response